MRPDFEPKLLELVEYFCSEVNKTIVFRSPAAAWENLKKLRLDS